MIRIEFQVNELELANDRKYDPAAAPAAALEATYFLMPVRFAVNSTELLAPKASSEPWLPLPLLGFAFHLYLAMAGIERDGERLVSIGGAGDLRLYRSGNVLHIESKFAQESVKVQLDDALAAAEKFRTRVRKFLADQVPKLPTHPSWPRWFA
jgi:hypothetical protein